MYHHLPYIPLKNVDVSKKFLEDFFVTSKEKIIPLDAAKIPLDAAKNPFAEKIILLVATAHRMVNE
jgi:hypothetical protein